MTYPRVKNRHKTVTRKKKMKCRLDVWMTERGETLATLARKTKKSQRTIWAIKEGGDCYVTTADLIAKKLKVTVPDIWPTLGKRASK